MALRSSLAFVAAAGPFAVVVCVGCQPIGGDDNGARLHWDPSAGSLPTFALGAEARVSIVDDCSASNPFNSCSQEVVVEIVTLEVDAEVLEVTPVDGSVGDFDVSAVGEGETQLFITARFDDDTEALRSADAVRKVAAVDHSALSLACRNGSASEPWLIPAGRSIAARASLRSSSSGDGELFHHDVDWRIALDFPDAAPAGLDGASTSPADLALTFSGTGAQAVLDEGGGAVTEVSLYLADDVDAIEVAAPSGQKKAGESASLKAVTFVNGASVCQPHAAQRIDIVVEDGSVCSLHATLTGEVQKSQALDDDIDIFAHAEGDCRVTVSLIDTALTTSVSFPVSAAPADDDDGE